MPDVVYSNSARVGPRGAVIPIEDRGFLFGDAVYEVLHEESISRERLQRTDQVFLTSTYDEVCAVIGLDGAPVGDSRVGAIAQWLLTGFRERVAAGDDAPRGA